jgi:hypothetical protein
MAGRTLIIAAVAIVVIVAGVVTSLVLLAGFPPSYAVTGIQIEQANTGNAATACAPAPCTPKPIPGLAGKEVSFFVTSSGTTRTPLCTVTAFYRGRRFGPTKAAIGPLPGVPKAGWFGIAFIGSATSGLPAGAARVSCR